MIVYKNREREQTLFPFSRYTWLSSFFIIHLSFYGYKCSLFIKIHSV